MAYQERLLCWSVFGLGLAGAAFCGAYAALFYDVAADAVGVGLYAFPFAFMSFLGARLVNAA